ncbi:MAG TPA: CBS domain-containing protein [Thermoanaerobaculia bacterium]|jgi:CBS domain-containing protein|nr:CBS domain-containing protein [Thermoanaerobaculia bacterium]
MKQIAELIEGRPLVHAGPNEMVRQVARRMSDRNVGAVAVLDSGKLVGVFSERDIMTRVVAQGLDADTTSVAEVMTREIVIADRGDDVNAALQKMSSLGCRHLPVVDDGNLIGMISLRDLLAFDGETSRQRASFLNELVTYSPDYES